MNTYIYHLDVYLRKRYYSYKRKTIRLANILACRVRGLCGLRSDRFVGCRARGFRFGVYRL